MKTEPGSSAGGTPREIKGVSKESEDPPVSCKEISGSTGRLKVSLMF